MGLSACGGEGGRAGAGQQSASGDGGATGYDGPPVTLAYWNGLTGGDGPIMKKLTNQFSQEHPNIKITTTTIAWAEYYQKLPVAVNQGKGPDIAIMHADTLATNAARQVIQPLDDVAKAIGITEDDLAPIVWQAGRYKDIQYGLALDIHPAGLYYNKTVMEKVGLDPAKPPTTGEELLTALETAKSKGVQGMWVSALSASGLLAQTLVYQFGGRMVADDGSTTEFGAEPAVKSIQWLKDLIDQGYSPKNAAGDGDFVSISNNKSLFMFNGPWMVTPMKALKGVEWGAAPVPNIGGTQATWAGSHQLVLPRQVKPDENKTTASRVLLNWLSQQSLAWADAGMVPARKSVRESAEFAKKVEVAEFAKELDYAKFPPPLPGINDTLTEWTPAVQNAMLGKKEVGAALAEAQDKANKILESNKKKYG